MAVDERRRSELFQAVTRVFGQEHAETMFELLPPPSTDLATRADIDELRADMNQLRTDMGADMNQLRADITQLRADTRADMNELLAVFRGELVAAVSGQTRAVIVAVAVAVFGIGGLAVTIAQVL